MSGKKKIVDALLIALSRNRIRCTYEAAGDLVGVPPDAVSQFLGENRPQASWIVSKSTELPSGYSETDYDPELFDNSYVIKTGAELSEMMQDD